jgi:predicted nucleic acid-binding protein
MESAILGLVLDSSVLIAAERRKLRPDQAIESVQKAVGEIPIVLCPLTVAEIGHGIYRANTAEIRQRRRAFLDELKATAPTHPVTEVTAEIIARLGVEEAAKGINLTARGSGDRSLRPGTWLRGRHW